MSEFSVVDIATGRVAYGGTSSDPSLLPLPGQVVKLGVRKTTGYFIGDDHFEIGEQPSPAHIFDYATKQWVDPRTLQDFKDTKWREMKATRDAEIDAPLATPFGSFDADPKARSNITDAIMMLQTLASQEQYPSIDFTLADNTTVSLDVTSMTNVGLLLGQKVQIAHGKARVLRAQIESATSSTELEAIVWTS